MPCSKTCRWRLSLAFVWFLKTQEQRVSKYWLDFAPEASWGMFANYQWKGEKPDRFFWGYGSMGYWSQKTRRPRWLGGGGRWEGKYPTHRTFLGMICRSFMHSWYLMHQRQRPRRGKNGLLNIGCLKSPSRCSKLQSPCCESNNGEETWDYYFWRRKPSLPAGTNSDGQCMSLDRWVGGSSRQSSSGEPYSCVLMTHLPWIAWSYQWLASS